MIQRLELEAVLPVCPVIKQNLAGILCRSCLPVALQENTTHIIHFHRSKPHIYFLVCLWLHCLVCMWLCCSVCLQLCCLVCLWLSVFLLGSAFCCFLPSISAYQYNWIYTSNCFDDLRGCSVTTYFSEVWKVLKARKDYFVLFFFLNSVSLNQYLLIIFFKDLCYWIDRTVYICMVFQEVILTTSPSCICKVSQGIIFTSPIMRTCTHCLTGNNSYKSHRVNMYALSHREQFLKSHRANMYA